MTSDQAMRASDHDRERAAEVLRDAYAVGRLDLEEFHDRAGAAYSAKTWGELRHLTADLPAWRLPGQGEHDADSSTAPERPGTTPQRPFAFIWVMPVIWLAIAAARVFGKPLLLTTDATALDPRHGARWRAALKNGLLLPYLYRRVADLVLVPSTASRRFVRSLGVPADRVVLTPYVVDNDAIAAAAARAERNRVRKRWQIPEDAVVLMCCAKFLPRKRPHDILEAFAQANVPNSHLLMVGDGPLADSLKTGANRLGVGDRVHFPGLVKYSALPEHYVASDALILASEHEPYGLPVNEAMVCGVPAIVSDRVGAGYDLVEHGKTGLVYPCGDVDALAGLLSEALRDSDTLRRMGEAARRRMESWSPRENADAIVRAVETAIALRQPRAGA